MYNECVDKLSVSDSESVLYSTTEPIIRFLLKLGFVPPASIMRMGIVSRFRFLVFKYVF